MPPGRTKAVDHAAILPSHLMEKHDVCCNRLVQYGIVLLLSVAHILGVNERMLIYFLFAAFARAFERCA